jgi:sugar/nucleoside kinase (ribokinase family)
VGHPNHFLISNDETAKIIIAELTKRSIPTASLLPILKKTARTVILINKNGDKTMFSDPAEMESTLTVNELYDYINITDPTQTIHVTPTHWSKGLTALIHKNHPSARISTDFHTILNDESDITDKYRDHLPHNGILFFSGANKPKPHFLNQIKAALSQNIKIICCTNGGDGVYVGTNQTDEIKHYRAVKPPDPIIDTVGAGDTFAATFLHYYYATNDINRSIHLAQL